MKKPCKASILDDVDFQLELIHRNEINVTYILKLPAKLKEAKPEEKEIQEKSLVKFVAGDAKLRTKWELIEKFIRENLPEIEDPNDIPDECDNFCNKERKRALTRLSKEENVDAERLQTVIGNYLFTEKTPMRDEVIGLGSLRGFCLLWRRILYVYMG